MTEYWSRWSSMTEMASVFAVLPGGTVEMSKTRAVARSFPGIRTGVAGGRYALAKNRARLVGEPTASSSRGSLRQPHDWGLGDGELAFGGRCVLVLGHGVPDGQLSL
jgi:hypothetical protein